MKNIILILALSTGLVACDMLHKAEKSMDAVQEMGDKMDTMNNNMNQMAYDQRLALPLNGLLNKDYYDMVNPIAFKLAPWAEGLAKYVNVIDLLKFSEIEFLSIDDGTFKKDVNEEGRELPYTLQDKVKMNNQKLVVISFLSQIAGLLPASTVNGLIDEAREGARSATAIKLLTLRYSFIKDFMFDSARMGKTFTNVAMAQEAFNELEKADALARLDRNNELSFVTKGLMKLKETDEDPNYNVQIDHNELKSQWKRLLRKMEADQPVSKLQLGLSNSQLDANRAQSAKRLEALKTQVQNKIDYWNSAK